MPTDECGVCRKGTHPVVTDHFEIYEWIAQWNIDATATFGGFKDSDDSDDDEEEKKEGEGEGEGKDDESDSSSTEDFHEFINFQCLCMDLSTGAVTQSTILEVGSVDDFDDICTGSLRSVFNG